MVPEVSGSICPVSDLRSPFACGQTPTNGTRIIERGSGKSALATATAAFHLQPKADMRTVLEVGFGQRAFQPSVVSVTLSRTGAEGVLVPMVPLRDWENLRAALGAASPDGSAALAVYVQRQGRPVAGAQILGPPGMLNPIFYDGPSPLNWSTGATGAAGAGLLLGVPAQASTTEIVVIAPGGSIRATYSQVPIASGGTTFLFVELPGPRVAKRGQLR
jgi:hypothetical protein